MTDGHAQVNAVLSMPMVPVVIVGHEDGHLRVYANNQCKSHRLLTRVELMVASTKPKNTILAHPSPITSLSLSPSSPTHILTSSTDCTVRLWDLDKETSIQELGGHRKRSDEGVCAVTSHPEQPVIASAGADGVVRLWAAAA